MSVHTVKHFDVLDFVNKSKELGVDEKVATFQARQIEQIVEIVEQQAQLINQQIVKLTALKSKEPATKGDVRESELRLKADLKKLEIKILTLYGCGFLVLLSILAKGFHWI